MQKQQFRPFFYSIYVCMEKNDNVSVIASNQNSLTILNFKSFIHKIGYTAIRAISHPKRKQTYQNGYNNTNLQYSDTIITALLCLLLTLCEYISV